MKKRVLCLSVALAASLYAEVFELGKIEVSGQGPENGTVNDVISQNTMQKYNTKTLSDSLNLLSGINIQNGGGRNEQMIMMRGFDIKHTPLMQDGIPIAVPYDGYVDMTRFTTFDLSEIEVSKGVLASVLYGPNTFAGAINMVSRKPVKEFELDVGLGAFTGNGYDEYLNFGSNQGSYYFTASLSGTQQMFSTLGDGFNGNMYQGGGKRNNSYNNDVKGNLKLAYTPNSKDEYAIAYQNITSDKGVPPYAGPFNTSITNNAFSNGVVNNTNGGGIVHFWQWDYWNKESLYLLTNTDFERFYVKFRLSTDFFKNSLSMYTNPSYSVLSNGTNPSLYNDNTQAASMETGIKTFDKDILKLAVHYKLDTHNETGTYYNVAGQQNYSNAPKFTTQDQISSFGAEYHKPFLDKFKIIAGLSYDFENMLKAQNSNYGSTAGVFTSGATSTNGGRVLTSYNTQKNFATNGAYDVNPMAKLNADLTDSTSSYIGFGQKSRLPSIKDRLSYKLGNFVPNPNLNPEKIIGFEAGGVQKFNGGNIKGSLFISNVYNYIQSTFVPIWYNTSSTANGKTTVTSTQQQQLQNVGTVNQKGFELEGDYVVNEYLALSGNFTRLLMQNTTTPSTLIVDVPNNKLMLAADIMPTQDLVWTNSYMYQSQSWTNYGQSNIPGQLNTYYSSGVVGLWYTKLAYHPVKNASVELGINNVLNRNYNVTFGYPGQGQVVFANLRYKI